jgi:DNA-3-methyladenine glycosylase II
MRVVTRISETKIYEPKIFDDRNFEKICDQLALIDRDFTTIIDAHGYPPMWTRANSFETLVHIILEQQVSLASALAALNKLRAKLVVVSPENLLALTDEELKSCYFSRQKTIYARGLASAIVEGRLVLEELPSMTDEEAGKKLKSLNGIGQWTTDVYLMFVLRRADIFPAGDLAAVQALKKLKKLPKDIPRDEMLAITEKWRPYRTIASMLLWHLYLSAPKKGIHAG